jgi:adenylate kinase family enzyme
MRLVTAELKPRAGKRWMLDGFPRTQAQAKLVDENFRIDFVVNVDVPHEEVSSVASLGHRWPCLGQPSTTLKPSVYTVMCLPCQSLVIIAPVARSDKVGVRLAHRWTYMRTALDHNTP